MRGGGPAHRLFLRDNALDVRQEPRIDLGDLVDVVDADARAQRFGELEQALRRRHRHAPLELGGVGRQVAIEAVRPVSSERIRLASASLKVRPIDMTSPTDFICVVKVASAPGNFSKAKRGTLTTT